MRITSLIHFFLRVMVVFWIAVGGFFVTYAYSKGWIFAGFESIEAKEAIALLHNDSNVTLLDVRTDKEYEQRHIKNAIHIPVQLLTTAMNQLEKNKNRMILVYCKSGNRSVKASRILSKNGFMPLNVKGGIRQLIRDNAEVEK